MSVTDDHNQPASDPERSGDGHETGPPQARTRRTPWRGWVWSVPLAAIILVAYLAVRTWLLAGPTITITFPKTAGISSSGTPLQYKGLKVGSVQSVSLTDNKKAVQVTVSVKGSITDFLRSGTQFWIVHPSILSGDVSELISGPHLAMRPGKGQPTRQFKGLLQPPAAIPQATGKSVSLHALSGQGLQAGAPVLYHGLNAGQVLSVGYDKKRGDTRIRLFVDQPFASNLAANTRFWRTGGMGLSTSGSGVSFNLPSLNQLLKGAVAFGVVQSCAPHAGASASDTRLYASAAAAHSVLSGQHVRFAARFPGSETDITAGSPVMLDGTRVGTVRRATLTYDPKQKAMVIPATFDLYPQRFGIGQGQISNSHAAPSKKHNPSNSTDTDSSSVAPSNQTSAPNCRPVAPRKFKRILGTLVSRGLRAQLATKNPVFGGAEVSLVMAGRVGRASLDTTVSPPRIPTVGASGIASIISRLGQLTKHLNQQIEALPIQAIGHHLDKTLANLQAVSGQARGQVKPTLKRLRRVADATRAAADTVNRLMGGSRENQENVQHLVSELTRAARSVRVLANYLQRHPEALIKGRH